MAAAAAGRGGTRRVAVNSILQAGADALGKIGLLALYSVMARQLGPVAFGDFTSAASLAVLVLIAAFGMDYVVTRHVAQGEDDVARVYWAAVVLKLLFGTVATAMVMGVAVVGPYADRVVLTTAVLSLAMIVDLVMLTPHALFRGLERVQVVARALVLYRALLAVLGVAAMLAGGGIAEVAVIWLACALLALGYTLRRVRDTGLALPFGLRRSDLRRVALGSLALGVAGVFGAALSRLDIIILGLLKDSEDVAIYGSAYRLIESVQFVTTAIALSAFPSLSRLSRTSRPTLGEAAALGVKAVLLVTLPIALGLGVFAEPVLRLVYGGGLADADTALTLLSLTIVPAGLCSFLAFLLSAQGRQTPVAVSLGIATVVNVGLNLLLVPPHGPEGAAVAMVATMAVMSAALLGPVLSATGPIGAVRVLTAPAVGAACGVAVGVALGGELLAAPLSLTVFGAVTLGAERVLHPADARVLLQILRRRPPAAETAAPAGDG
ncbi:MAG TPA: oligosaccharide flippase family protein [Baekduia sp.]|nr:oligosaccharide flippase family protein [Baekduia sp.]